MKCAATRSDAVYALKPDALIYGDSESNVVVQRFSLGVLTDDHPALLVDASPVEDDSRFLLFVAPMCCAAMIIGAVASLALAWVPWHLDRDIRRIEDSESASTAEKSLALCAKSTDTGTANGADQAEWDDRTRTRTQKALRKKAEKRHKNWSQYCFLMFAIAAGVTGIATYSLFREAELLHYNIYE